MREILLILVCLNEGCGDWFGFESRLVPEFVHFAQHHVESASKHSILRSADSLQNTVGYSQQSVLITHFDILQSAYEGLDDLEDRSKSLYRKTFEDIVDEG